jgi:signal transduction histidine kinase
MNNLAKEGQRIDFSCTGDEMVFIDKGLLHNVLVNLVSNSIKYSGNEGRITIAVHHTSDILSVTIQDNGMGISEEDLRHLTDRFFRESNAIEYSGYRIRALYRTEISGRNERNYKLHQQAESRNKSFYSIQ